MPESSILMRVVIERGPAMPCDGWSRFGAECCECCLRQSKCRVAPASPRVRLLIASVQRHRVLFCVPVPYNSTTHHLKDAYQPREHSTAMASVSVPPKGVFVPSPTFFRAISDNPSATAHQAAVDVATQTEHTLFLARSGITGVVLLGSTGEAIHLSAKERFDLVSGVKQGLENAGFKDYPIMAGVLTSGGIEETLAWLDDYAKAGAQWGLVLAPGYFGPAANQANLEEWYGIVADASPIPILVYNYPGVTNNVVVLPETYTNLAAHPKIVGCKM